ncbi:glycoside hydrolase family 104 protein [Cronobacter turicensis]|nr:glycoside hydrolase family 104 protein [Cronobacter turicensis]NHV62236.1 glycoside hydrolase family 104 protein [Cronobacter turicensis]NHW09177.1 glycoside hydrolase family 104 protein [Cronobacter turicensis]
MVARKYKYGNGQCAKYVKAALISGGASSVGSDINAAKDYGAWLESIGFEAVKSATTVNMGGVYSVSSQRAGDVVVIQNAPGHPYGHMTMFNGTCWVSDYVQDKGFYPAQVYRDQNTKYVLYHYKNSGSENMAENSSQKSIINICYPIRMESGQEFNHTDEILAHLEGESTGFFLIGRNGMWHGGIHITDATTPWCALSGNGAGETAQYNGQQAVRCMADGEVVAYRLCKNYIPVSGITGPLSVSGSLVLVRHYIQPGKTEKSGLHFYTLYMHLAPYCAYPQDSKLMKVADGQHLNAYIDDMLLWCVRSLPGGTRVSWDKTDAAATQKAKNGRQYARVSLVDGLEGNPALSAGDRVWVVCDRGNLVPEDDGPVRPAWWAPLMASAKDKMQFDAVVCVNEPFAIAAGAPVGHLGFVQAPTEAGTESRYQVHIECLSTDDNLENFLTNPEATGKDNPLYIRCTPGLALYQHDVNTGFIKTAGSTKEDTLLLLSNVPVETGGTRDKPEQYYHFPEGFVLKGETSPEQLSQYDMGKLGFTVMKGTPESFVHLDGKKQPKGLVRQLYEKLLEVSQKDRRVSNALDPHNYRRLLNKIDSNSDGLYSPEEYRRAVHNPTYRDTLYKTIVMHPSDWYYRSDEDMWAGFIKTLEKYASEWVPYTQQFTDRLCWMQELKKLKLGPILWHMHPIMFLNNFSIKTIPLEEARVRAFLRMIRNCEGTEGEDGYERLFGGESFIKDYRKTFDTHPQIKVKKKNKKTGVVYISSAAGAYQVMGYTWSDPYTIILREKYGINDFTPESQDLLCVVFLKEKVLGDALNMIINNHIKEAIEKSCSYEWASLPPGRHGQPIKSLNECLKNYNSYLQEELAGKTNLHLKNGFLNEILR